MLGTGGGGWGVVVRSKPGAGGGAEKAEVCGDHLPTWRWCVPWTAPEFPWLLLKDGRMVGGGGRGSHPHSYSLEGRVKNNHREGLGLDYACVPQARALMK